MFDLRPSLDCERLSRLYSERGRVECENFLAPHSAEYLLNGLVQEVDWSIAIIDSGRVKEIRSETRRQMTERDREIVREIAYQSAESGFSYHMEVNRRTDSEGETQQRALLAKILSEFATFISTEPRLSFFRTVVQSAHANRIDVLATRFGPGDFLSFHSDDEGEARKAAFVLNLTSGWDPSWGGLLQFVSPDGRLDTIVPRFNTLHIFKIPQPHAVSLVAPYAQRLRYGVSGWIYE